MSRFLVAGFIQIETIVKVDKLPVPYSYFTSVPDMIHTDLGGAGYNEARALTWQSGGFHEYDWQRGRL